MSRWRQHLKDLFGRSAPAAAMPASVADTAVPATRPPDQPAAEMYETFRREIAPILQVLKDLPPNKDGLEFFTRTDVVTADMAEQAGNMRIDVWLFYTRETKPNGKLHQAPNSYLISLESKWSTPEKLDFSQMLALSDTPVLRLCVRPQETGDTRITSHTYIERYEKPQAGKKYSIYSGDYGMVHDESDKTPHTRVQDFAGVINNWLQEYAPAQKREMHAIMNPRTEIDLLRPLNIRKRQP